MPFIGQIQKLVSRIAPWYLGGKNVGTFLEAAAATLDASVVELDQGLRLSQPLRCDTSALPVLSKDRGIRLYPSESTDSKRIRLSQWLQLHRQRATHIGEMRHSIPYFLPNTPVMRIVHQDGAGATASWWTIGADGTADVHLQTPSNWNYDGQTSKWSRFWVILYAPAGFLDFARYDDGGTWDSGEYYDGLTSTQIALDLIAMITEWQGAHSHLAGYIIATDPTSFDPTATATTDPTGWTSLPVGNWGAPISSGGVRTRPPSAVWIYEA